MKKKTNHIINILLVFILLVGLSLLLYPTLSDYWNSFHQTQAISGYAEQVTNMDEKLCAEMLREAREYNEAISSGEIGYTLTDEQKAKYDSLLDISGIGVMGYIEVPKINCALPIYHGTAESALQTAVGHLEWSSLPVGGESTHCVLSGHRGLPSAKLFTDLDKLVEGDVFMLCVLNEVFTYEVDQILIVEPDDTDSLHITDGEDLCTLVTCTPYGVNTHRLLVRGHRIENIEESEIIRVTADAVQIEPLIVAPIVAIPMLLVLLVVLLLPKRKNKERGGDPDEKI